jgi:hypothetical protein
MKNNLEKLAKELNIENMLRFLGFVPDAKKLLSGADMFLLPSRTEAFPYTILEAGMAGVPIIATSVGGVPEVIHDMQNGILVHPQNPKEIAEAILYYIDHPEKQKEYRRWLTDEVRKIFKKERGDIEKTTGRKVVVRSKKAPENKEQVSAASTPEVGPVKSESGLSHPEISSQPEIIENKVIEVKKPEAKIETLPGYEIGQGVEIVFPDPKNRDYYFFEKGSIFKGVKEENGEKIVMLEKDGKPYSMLLSLFLEIQKTKTLAQDPEELTRDLPDFPGLAGREEKPKLKTKKPETIVAPQFPEGFRKRIRKGAKLKRIIKRGKKLS